MVPIHVSTVIQGATGVANVVRRLARDLFGPLGLRLLRLLHNRAPLQLRDALAC